MSDGAAGHLRRAVDDAVATALGRRHREDGVAPRTGGGAGNARLTAWLGAALLVLAVAELVTLLDVRGLITWHLALGLLLVPAAVAKTASTGWRVLRYYTGSSPYVAAGPPPVLLRVLGPLVVLGTSAVLGTGIALLVVGPSSGRDTLLTAVGQRVSLLTLHQASFLVWAAATGLHVLARLVPAWQLVRGRDSVPGRAPRAAALGAVTAVAAVTTVAVLGTATATAWRNDETHHGGHRHDAVLVRR